jgi:hypothetical protein
LPEKQEDIFFSAKIINHYLPLLFLSHSGTIVAFDVIGKGGVGATGRRQSFIVSPLIFSFNFTCKVYVSLYNYLVKLIHAVLPKMGGI